MHEIVMKSALVFIFALAVAFSLAQDVSPDVVLKAVTLEVIG